MITYLLPFIFAGLATGAVYGLAATGLVLTYKTSGIFNFGHGAIATVAAYVFYWMHVDQGWDWKVAAVVSVGVVGPVLGLLMEGVGRRLSEQRLVYKVVGTVGLIVMVQGLAVLKYGSTTLPFPQFLPGSGKSFVVDGAVIQYSSVEIAAISLIAVGALVALFRFTRTGTAMRAVVDDSDLLSLQGTDPIRVRRTAWITGCCLAALSGILVAPLIGLDSILLTFLILQAFGAAAIGAFANIPLAFVGGLLLGIGASVSQKYVVTISWLTGLPASLPFLVLLAVLLILPKRKLLPPVTVIRRTQSNYKGPPLLRASTAVVVLIPLGLVPIFVGAHLAFYSAGLIAAIVVLSLGVLVKTSGQVSLCHAAFMAIGACAFSEFSVNLHMNWFLAMFLGALVVVPVGALVAIPSIRLSGLFLALATFGFGVMVAQLFYPTTFLFGALSTGRAMPRPSFAESDRNFYYVILGALVLTAVVMVAIHESRLGRLLRGMSESPLAVSTLGLSLTVTRVLVFCVSAFFAAIGGSLYGQLVHFASSTDPEYSALYSLILVATLIIAPFREPWYVLPAALGAVIPAYWTSGNSTYWLDALFGFFAIVVSLQGGPVVMPDSWRAPLTRRFTTSRARPKREHQPTATEAVHPAGRYRDGAADGQPIRTGLQATGLTVRFGGLVAVSDLTISVPLGRITGLIGPNGAGKTTTFNACNGLNRPAHGTVSLNGHDVSRKSPAARARLGLGRTFQRMELCDGLTVEENVSLGREASQAGNHIFGQIFASGEQHHLARAATTDAMVLCGLTDLAQRRVGDLSTGQRRLVELARTLAGPFDVLLLDEPSSGLDRAETARFSQVLMKIVATRGCGVLLVEHDMNLVLDICDHIYVLDYGQLLFEGSPIEVASSAAVRTAYLGEAEPEAPPQVRGKTERFAEPEVTLG